jgi:hypothetical protein
LRQCRRAHIAWKGSGKSLKESFAGKARGVTEAAGVPGVLPVKIDQYTVTLATEATEITEIDCAVSLLCALCTLCGKRNLV